MSIILRNSDCQKPEDPLMNVGKSPVEAFFRRMPVGNLQSLHKEKFGINSNKDQAEAKRNKATHEKNQLHQWCQKQLKAREEESLKAQDNNKKVATLIASNAAFCFLTGGSSEDFVRLNDKDALAEGLLTATKNDGK